MSQNETDTLRSSILISALDLKRAVQKDNLVLLDVRFRPDGPDGRDAYRDGHIPGAVYVDLPTELAREPKGFQRPSTLARDPRLTARRAKLGCERQFGGRGLRRQLRTPGRSRLVGSPLGRVGQCAAS